MALFMLQQVSYKGHNCELTVDYEDGFTLKDGQNGSVVFNRNFPGRSKLFGLRRD